MISDFNCAIGGSYKDYAKDVDKLVDIEEEEKRVWLGFRTIAKRKK